MPTLITKTAGALLTLHSSTCLRIAAVPLLRAKPLDWTRGAGRPPFPRPQSVDVIVPIYGAAEDLERCLKSVVAETDLAFHNLILVVDGPQSEEVESIVRAFAGHAAQILRNDNRRGFVESVNRGMAASSRDVLLLNSDTIVTPRWLEKLIDASVSSGDVGTVTPLSNNATLCSVPRWFKANLIPSGLDPASFAALVERVSERTYPRIPTAVGFCIFIRRALLDDIGPFDSQRFGLGYGEENDFCMRALARGWVHIADDATFIAHAGHRSFGSSREALQRKAARTLNHMHPAFMPTLERFVNDDPLAPIRARIDGAIHGRSRPFEQDKERSPARALIRTIAGVVRSESLGSAVMRARERIDERMRLSLMLARGVFSGDTPAPLLNVFMWPPAGRLGGAAIQLRQRMHEERALRDVALFYPGIVERPWHARRGPALEPAVTELFQESFERAVTSVMERSEAKVVHFEGTAGVPIGSVLQMTDRGISVLLTVHDFSLFCARPHLMEEPRNEFCGYSVDADRCHHCLQQTWNSTRDQQAMRRTAARQLLQRARAVIFPSDFLFERHRELFSIPDLRGHVIAPGSRRLAVPQGKGGRMRVAYVGSVKRHKGAHLLPKVIDALADLEIEWHVFGGGDESMLRVLRNLPRVTVHGYYRSESLPSLLRRHEIDLGLLLSIWPESYCMTLSECWSAGVPVVAFAHGAPAERIERHGGGWLAALAEGAHGIAGLVRRWFSGEITTTIPRDLSTPRDAALAHVGLYRGLGLLD